MVFHGNELSFGIILAAWMLWVGVGSGLGAVVIERSGRPWLFLALSAPAVPALPAAVLVLVRVLRGIFAVQPGEYLSVLDMALSSLVVMAPVGVLLGAQFVLLARAWRESDRGQDTSAAGKAYAAEAAGTLVGGLLFTFILVRHFSSFHAAVLAGSLMLAAILWQTRKQGAAGADLPVWLRRAMVGVLVLCAGAFPFLGRLDAWAYERQWRLFAPEYRLVETRQSKHGAVALLRLEDQYSLFQSGHLVFSTAGPEATAPALEEQEGVVFAHFALVQHENPRRVLLIGGGLRGTLREALRHPVERIDYIELDPVLTGTARAYVPPATVASLESPRVQLVHTDGRLFVKTTDRSYDMIIVDVPDPVTAALNRYYTEEFFREASTRLAADGVLVIGAVSTPDMRGSAVTNRNAAIYHTLRGVFPQVLPVGERFLFFFAGKSPGQVSSEAPILRSRYLERGIDAPGFSPGFFDLLLEEGSLRRINWIIRHHGRRRDAHLLGPDSGPLFPDSLIEQERGEADLPPVERSRFVNSDFRPVGYYYSLLFWNVLSRGDHKEAFGWIMRVEPWWAAVAVAACLAAVWALRLVDSRRAGQPTSGRRAGGRADVHFAVLVAVFTTGLSTMALQIALLFSFQSIYGFVYEMVGLIVAVFMGGLALGAGLSHRLIRRKSDLRILAAVQLLIVLFAVALAVALPRVAALRFPGLAFASISTMTFAAGFLNGLDFPLATACCLVVTGRVEKATGMVYGVELFGACAGALLASVVVAPVMGITACCLLAAVANATAFAGLWICRDSREV